MYITEGITPPKSLFGGKIKKKVNSKSNSKSNSKCINKLSKNISNNKGINTCNNFRNIVEIKENSILSKISPLPIREIYFNNSLLNEIQCFDRLYDKHYKIFSNKNFLKLYHPFVQISSLIKTSSLKKSVKITNAFKKAYEIFKFIYPRPPNSIKLFDIASAPCMFIICAEMYFENVDWQNTSLLDNKNHSNKFVDKFAENKFVDNTLLDDIYGVIANNPDRFHPGDVTLQTDRERIIKNTKTKFDIVMGDIGAPQKEYNNKLQEIVYKDLFVGQFILAMHLCNLHGNIALKMYSLISYNSLRIVDTLKEHFEKAFIVKPFTSKLFNYECYIIGINKLSEEFNEKNFQDSLEKGMSESSVSETLIEHFERERAADKMRIANLY
jgi:hypothetical protein